jgi:hypothetical protein
MWPQYWKKLRVSAEKLKCSMDDPVQQGISMFKVVFWDILPCKIIVIPDDGGSTHL